MTDTPDEIIRASQVQIPIDGDLSADRVRALMDRDHEEDWLDYKHTWVPKKKDIWAELAYDLAGMAQTDGGWVVVGLREQPIGQSPNLRREMSQLFQPTPIEVEQILQGKSRLPGDRSIAPAEEELTLADAVGRMTEAALQAKREGLVLSLEAWERLVLQHLNDADTIAFLRDVLDRAGPIGTKEMPEWLARAQAIWNATPQSDRGGKTAHELSRERRSG